MEHDCDKCVFHIGGACSIKCKGTVTLQMYRNMVYNKALDDFIKAIEKQQQENWIGNLEYGITFDDLETVKNELKSSHIYNTIYDCKENFREYKK